MQNLWKRKISLDTPIPSALQDRWHSIARDINTVSTSDFNRYLFDSEADDTEYAADDTTIHVFSDSSIMSYGAAVYICKGNHSSLVLAKSRVAPLKGLTLPRLELMGAVIGALLAKHVRHEMEISKTLMWLDSQIVLQWLQTSKPLPQFVRNRVTEIHKLDQNWE
jgi:hypothetical protein